jgi:membrane protein
MTLVSRLWRSKIAQLFIQTFIEWQKDDCLKMGAALAYYALFSFFPFILVLLSIFGWLVGPESQLKEALSAIARDSLPKDAFPVVVTTLAQLNQGSTKAGIIGFILLLLSASGFFSALDDALDHIWNVRHRPQQSFNLFRAIRTFLQQKLIAFSLVLAATLFIQLTLFANVAVGIFLQIVNLDPPVFCNLS